jgi:hypothetical protein
MRINADQFSALNARGLSPIRHDLSGFAEACYNDNTADDLMSFDSADADRTDMEAWGITEQEWRDAQRQALEAAMAEFADDE